MNPYNYLKKQCLSESYPPCDIYTFKNDLNDVVILEVQKYDYSVYVIKFYLKKHRLSKKRYSFQYSKKEYVPHKLITGNSNFIRTLDIILSVGLQCLQKDPLASFSFMGFPKQKDIDRFDLSGPAKNTKKYLVYKKYCLRIFPPENYTYIDSPDSSILFIRNNKIINLQRILYKKQ